MLIRFIAIYCCAAVLIEFVAHKIYLELQSVKKCKHQYTKLNCGECAKGKFSYFDKKKNE